MNNFHSMSKRKLEKNSTNGSTDLNVKIQKIDSNAFNFTNSDFLTKKVHIGDKSL